MDIGGGHMRSTSLSRLGTVASAVRRMRLGTLLDYGCRGTDGLLISMGVSPLRATFDGITLRGNLRHRGFLVAVAEHRYEPTMRRMFLSAAADASVVIDGGAHVGLYSVLASHVMRPEAMVLAFEPDPYNYVCLTQNLKRNQCRNVQSTPRALSDTKGFAELYPFHGSISSSLVHRHESGQRKPIRVETTTISSELKGLDLTHLVVKLDIEGAEPLALRGMESALARAAKVTMFVELHPSALSDGGFAGESLVDQLRKMGMRIEYIDEGCERLTPVSEETSIRKGNLYCTKV